MPGERMDDGPSWEETNAIISGVGPDLEVQRMVEEEEHKRREREAAEGKGVKVVVYDPGTGDIETARKGRMVILIVVLAIVLVPVLYLVAIPRADAELVIEYHEGLVGGINVDARIENHGTRAMTDVTVTILVQNSTDVRMAEPSVFEGSVSAHNWAGMEAISFNADQWEVYHIFVEYSFDCAGRSYQGTEHIIAEGDGMNMWFHKDMTS